MGKLERCSYTQDKVLGLLADGKPRSIRELTQQLGVSDRAVEGACLRAWRSGSLLRSDKPMHVRNRTLAGRAGSTFNTRSFYLYAIGNGSEDNLIDGLRFLSFLQTPKMAKHDKAQLVLNFLRENANNAFYTSEIAGKLKDKGVTIFDIATNLRRYERKGMVYFRGYRSAEHETPFAAGYIVTYIDQNKQREVAIAEANERTELLLAGGSHANPLAERIRTIRDELLKARELKEIVSSEFLKQKLQCKNDQLRLAMDRATQLYRDEIKEVKVFNFPHYYHSSLDEEDLKVAIADKQDYIRRVKGKHNRIGHNWEACVEFFVDKLTRGAEFKEQTHRTRMDKRRITLKLLKPIGDRKLFAEVDRVWTIQPSPISQPVIYVLECKWGLITKKQLEDFLNVLKWSFEFGVDTPQGRTIKQGVIGIFAGTAFNPNEKVRVGADVLSVAQYAARMNIQLLKAADLNELLHKKGVDKRITAQKICVRAKSEFEVREALDKVWLKPEAAPVLLDELASKNAGLFEFERRLEMSSETSAEAAPNIVIGGG
jgi:hypothetical protein